MKYVGSLHALASCDTGLRRACRPSQLWSRKVLQVGDITPSGTDAPTRITACHRSADNRSALNSARRAQSQPPHGPPNPAPVLTRQPTARHWVAPGRRGRRPRSRDCAPGRWCPAWARRAIRKSWSMLLFTTSFDAPIVIKGLVPSCQRLPRTNGTLHPPCYRTTMPPGAPQGHDCSCTATFLRLALVRVAHRSFE